MFKHRAWYILATANWRCIISLRAINVVVIFKLEDFAKKCHFPLWQFTICDDLCAHPLYFRRRQRHTGSILRSLVSMGINLAGNWKIKRDKLNTKTDIWFQQVDGNIHITIMFISRCEICVNWVSNKLIMRFIFPIWWTFRRLIIVLVKSTSSKASYSLIALERLQIILSEIFVLWTTGCLKLLFSLHLSYHFQMKADFLCRSNWWRITDFNALDALLSSL